MSASVDNRRSIPAVKSVFSRGLGSTLKRIGELASVRFVNQSEALRVSAHGLSPPCCLPRNHGAICTPLLMNSTVTGLACGLFKELFLRRWNIMSEDVL